MKKSLLPPDLNIRLIILTAVLVLAMLAAGARIIYISLSASYNFSAVESDSDITTA